MKISVTAKTKSKMEGVELLQDNTYIVRVNVPPIEGRANKRIIELLSEFLKVPKSQIELVSGVKSKHKIFKIHGQP